MQKAPLEVHAGADSTAPEGAAPATSITGREAQAAGIEGRSSMDKSELVHALQRH
jgi:hypothetical protein